MELIKNTRQTADKTAIIAGNRAYTYGELLDQSVRFAGCLLEGRPDLGEARVAFMADPGFDYVRIQWGIWLAGGIAVPLCTTHPLPALRYTLEDTGAEILVASGAYADQLAPVIAERGLRRISLEEEGQIPGSLPEIGPERRAMILYTSGTTNLPKGVVTTHGNLENQIAALIDAWEWTERDRILCVLPLHHVHGIINVVSCALWAGACVEFLPAFSPEAVFEAFEAGRINVFMAVPTIYFKLIAWWEVQSVQRQKNISACLRNFRLMVSGSAALPVSVLEKWKKISGHTLLERYGMTEIGMAISNPYHGERRPGFVGMPLPGVDIRLADEKDQPVGTDQPGEIQVKGGNVFLEYWHKPEATRESFTADGWFRTGDVAVLEDGYYKILGRNSVDIIKSGGYKISALEIEEVLRQYPGVRDCAVTGLPDEEWGEVVAAAIVVVPGFDLDNLKDWLREQLPAYRLPRRFTLPDDLPRNAMGKVVKGEVKKLFRDILPGTKS